MTAEQLEELRKLAALPPDSPTSKVMASLARRVLAAEKLVKAVSRVRSLDEDDSEAIVRLSDYRALRAALTAYREASK